MTTTVTVAAHLPSNKEVKVRVSGTGGADEVYTLQDGESRNVYAYDNRVISIREVEKSDVEAVG